ncbi:MAG: LuxR family transcriptional regulator [Alphaproteobacteria bacterium]
MAQQVSPEIEAISWQSTPEQIMTALDSAVKSLGFDFYAYYIIRPSRSYANLRNKYTYQEAWVDRYYNSSHNMHDITVLRATTTSLPYSWEMVRVDKTTSNRQQTIFNEASEYGLTHGVSIPLHGPDDGLALLSVAGKMSQHEFEKIWKWHRVDFTLLGTHVLEARLKLKSLNTEKVSPPLLTDRERECLTWTARGKTSWEVSKVLKISEKTVLFHLANIHKKLQVHSKHQAVVKALMMGLINI